MLQHGWYTIEQAVQELAKQGKRTNTNALRSWLHWSNAPIEHVGMIDIVRLSWFDEYQPRKDTRVEK